MALFEFRLPDIGEGVAEGEVVTWHVEPGQLIAEDQEMVEVMTDKATVTIGAPKAGRIAQLNANVGEKVRVGTVLVVIDTDASAETRRESKPPRPLERDTALSRFQAPAAHAQAAQRHSMRVIEDAAASKPNKRDEGPAASAVGDIREHLPGASFFARAKGNGRGRPSQGERGGELASYFVEKPLATPATRKLARDMGIDLRHVPPSGPGGRVTQEDVRSFTSPALAPQPRGPRATAIAPLAPSQREERRPFVGLRRRIAERMRTSKQTAAHFTFVEECDVDELKRMLERLRPLAEQAGVKLSYLPFIVKAVTLALKKHPILNSMLDEQSNELVYKRYYHIGIATATDQGLVVPVVRDADQKSPLSVAREIERLAAGARAGKLGAEELSGSTFTVTSLGKQGGLLATPVLNFPEVGILGVHRVKEKPVVKHGQIVVGNVMLLSLSFDHRIIDGHVGAAFAYDVIAYLESPEALLLELV